MERSPIALTIAPISIRSPSMVSANSDRLSENRWFVVPLFRRACGKSLIH